MAAQKRALRFADGRPEIGPSSTPGLGRSIGPTVSVSAWCRQRGTGARGGPSAAGVPLLGRRAAYHGAARAAARAGRLVLPAGERSRRRAAKPGPRSVGPDCRLGLAKAVAWEAFARVRALTGRVPEGPRRLPWALGSGSACGGSTTPCALTAGGALCIRCKRSAPSAAMLAHHPCIPSGQWPGTSVLHADLSNRALCGPLPRCMRTCRIGRRGRRPIGSARGRHPWRGSAHGRAGPAWGGHIESVPQRARSGS